MDELNFHHLRYFYIVAREGSVTRACEVLHVAQPTISGQIRMLENQLGERLFVKEGRGLQLTDVGRSVYRYAEEIFMLGRELVDVVGDHPSGGALRLQVGVASILPKLLVYRLIEPAFRLPRAVRIVFAEDSPDRLLADLVSHRLDVVLSDRSLGAGTGYRAFTHLLGETGLTVLGRRDLAETYGPGFPGSLDGAPLLLPAIGTVLRSSLDQWFTRERIAPRIAAEVADSALLKTLGEAGLGLFVAPAVVADEIIRMYRVEAVGNVEGVQERFYAITVQKRVNHPGVAAIVEGAGDLLTRT